MVISDFDYTLPEQLIAQEPADKRELSRMLVVDRSVGLVADKQFLDLPDFLRKDDVLVLNNTKVFPARLYGKSDTGANLETFLVKEIDEYLWEVLARPGKRLKIGRKITFSEQFSATVIAKNDDGKVIVKFTATGDLNTIIDEHGQTPLPPYIKRNSRSIDTDRERYQTVYASKRGAIAAPTAGLHFTPQTLDKIRNIGTSIAEITLHVGYGTFEPVRVEDLSLHNVLPERYEIDAETAELLNRAKNDGRRIVAIGTTTTRALESNIAEFGNITSGQYSAGLTITPDYRFQAVDALLTNFHLPKSSLLVLVSVFGGHELIMDAYRHAVAEQYRFYSYGDCMLLV